ncbi:uncharacterized protein LOC133353373 isoform X2 [Lethenteron reissneri]|uniref:uncharacterized protein LOC133353373 isoform X2 n=1 Tax=Lethenteron reissneri TaxID=7753 RepID=UPI002AB616B1|nr:uncharacterized protein LOC133353373 isoform X2 [Lethenteron reissneri]
MDKEDDFVIHTEHKRQRLEVATDGNGCCDVTCRTHSHGSSLPKAEPPKDSKTDAMCDAVKTTNFMGKIGDAVKLCKHVTEEPRDAVKFWPGRSTAPMPEDTRQMLHICNIIYKHYIEASEEKRLQDNKGTQSSHIIWNLPETNELPEVKCKIEAVHDETQTKYEGQIDASTESIINSNFTQGGVNGLQLSEKGNDNAKDNMFSSKEETGNVNIADENYSKSCCLPDSADICTASQEPRAPTISPQDRISTSSVNMETNTVTNGSNQNQSGKEAQMNGLDRVNKTHQVDDEKVCKQLHDKSADAAAISSVSLFMSETHMGITNIQKISDIKYTTDPNKPIQELGQLKVQLPSNLSERYCSQDNIFIPSCSVTRVPILTLNFEKNNAHPSNTVEQENILVTSKNPDVTTSNNNSNSLSESIDDISVAEQNDINLKPITTDLCKDGNIDEAHEGVDCSVSSGYSTGNIYDSHKAAICAEDCEGEIYHESNHAKLLTLSNKDLNNVSVTQIAQSKSVAIQSCKCLPDLNLNSICSSCVRNVPPFSDQSKLYKVDPEDMTSCQVVCVKDKLDISCARKFRDVDDRSTTGGQREMHIEGLTSGTNTFLETKEAVHEQDGGSTRYDFMKRNDQSKNIVLSGADRNETDPINRAKYVDYLNQERHEVYLVQKLNPTKSSISDGEIEPSDVNEVYSDPIGNTEVNTHASDLILKSKNIKRIGFDNLCLSYQLDDNFIDESCIYDYNTKIINDDAFTRHTDITKLSIHYTNNNIFSTGSIIRGSDSEAKGMTEPGLQHTPHARTDCIQLHPDDSLEVREAFILDTNEKITQIVPYHNSPLETSSAPINDAASNHEQIVPSYDSEYSEILCAPENNAESNQYSPINTLFINPNTKECINENGKNDKCNNILRMDPPIIKDMLPIDECDHLGKTQPCCQYKKLFNIVIEELKHFHEANNEMQRNESEQASAATTEDAYLIDATRSYSITAACSRVQQPEAILPDVEHFGLDRKPRATVSTVSPLTCDLSGQEDDASNVFSPIKGDHQWKSAYSFTSPAYDDHQQPLCTGTLPKEDVPVNRVAPLNTCTGLRRLGLSKYAKVKRLHPYLN